MMVWVEGTVLKAQKGGTGFFAMDRGRTPPTTHEKELPTFLITPSGIQGGNPTCDLAELWTIMDGGHLSDCPRGTARRGLHLFFSPG